ncbi:TPM domain-containing protein [Pusillimonas sp.]|uniref:TPM domain-containing protein n=1 Tax=Pusillimonas sp. TaxID=3040095 RepID=UPI0037C57A9B
MRVSNWRQLTGWGSIEGQFLRRRHFTSAVLEQIAQRIAECERTHFGELMLAVEAVSPAHEPDSHARALEVFGKLRVWDTPLNTGVLLYLALDRHSIELIADRGVAAPGEALQKICDRLRENLRRGSYVEGVLMAVDDIEAMCARYCPPSGSLENVNELPDRPIML